GREDFEVGALAGQVDADLLDARQLAQGAFDAAYATGAGHAADLQLDGAGRHAVASLPYRIDEGWQAVGRGLDPGLFGGKVDADLLGAGDLAQGALDAASAAGAGHAGDRQVESGGCGHGSPPWTGLQHQACHVGKVNCPGWRASTPGPGDPWQCGT